MTHNQPLRARRGVASMLAMLYLVLFSVLAVGFYATTTVSSQLSRNEQRVVEAELAADVGLDFMRFALYQVIIPSSAPSANLLTLVHGDLAELLEETGNLGSNTVSLSSGTIQVPAGSNNYIEAGDGHRFRAEITAPWAATSSDPKAKTLRVRVTGIAGTNRKVLQVEFDRDERPTDFFKIGMVSKGQVNILTKNIVQGSPADQARVI